MEDENKLAPVLAWMRLNGVKAYSQTPTGGFSIEMWEDSLTPQVALSPDDQLPEDDGDPLFFDGKRPAIKRIKL